VAGAIITVTSKDTAREAKAETNGDGSYVVPALRRSLHRVRRKAGIRKGGAEFSNCRYRRWGFWISLCRWALPANQ